jgi:ABC-type ATPase involved in cell division/GNAT superfamily N-acetyltransferase
MRLEIRHSCADFTSYRAERVKSLFNCEDAASFSLDVKLPIESPDWRIGLVVGPSGSGKSSIGRALFGPRSMVNLAAGWPKDAPIIDAIDPDGDFNAVTAALSAVGLGSVPAWLRPFDVLSNGERFRAGLARLVCAAPKRAVVDEWTSVIDRQIAKIGSLAFAKAWRRTGGQAVLLSCHYDVAEWLQPDWILDTATGKFTGACLSRRPPINLDLWETDWRFWPLFEPHHYLKLPRMVASRNYIGTVDCVPVCHLATSPRFEIGCMRACRLVVMPEWQGAGVGLRFLNAVCQLQLEGANRWGRKVPTIFHTSHPALCAALRRDPKWRQVSAVLVGSNKARSRESMFASQARGRKVITGSGYGGHFRAVQGFKYTGEAAP